MTEKGIEEIFKKAFENVESDVDPSVWTNVQQAINAPTATPANHGANGSFAGKAGAVAGKLGVKAIVAIIVAAVTGVSVGTYFLLSDTQSKKVVPATVQSQPQAAQVIPQQQSQVTNEPSATNPTISPQVNKVVPVQSEKDEKASPVAHAVPPASTSTAGMPAKIITAGGAAAATATQPAPAKVQQAASAPPPVIAKADEPKPAEEAKAPANHSYQNDFADINNYLETEPSSAMKGLPNVFSPNGDGKNDVLTIKTKNLKSLTVSVFDQSGKLIYRWNTLEGGWDGNLPDGRQAPPGNYFYSLLAETIDGKQCIGSSSPTLMR